MSLFRSFMDYFSVYYDLKSFTPCFTNAMYRPKQSMRIKNKQLAKMRKLTKKK